MTQSARIIIITITIKLFIARPTANRNGQALQGQ